MFTFISLNSWGFIYPSGDLPIACPSLSPPKVLRGGYVSRYIEKDKELGLVMMRID